VNKRPPELPNIEDATLRACLAPLMDAMHAPSDPPRLPVANSNDNPAPVASGEPRTLPGWRAQADEDFGLFRTIELFLGMTDAELEHAAAEFPRQIGGTVARIAAIKRRLATQYDTVTTVVALLERAISRAEIITSVLGD